MKIESKIIHLAQIAMKNCHWHRDRFKENGDRMHLGQWRAYRRVWKKLLGEEKGRKINE